MKTIFLKEEGRDGEREKMRVGEGMREGKMMYNIYWYNFNITDSWRNMYFTYTLIASRRFQVSW